jgi:Domain of unknown function (DUF6046)
MGTNKWQGTYLPDPNSPLAYKGDGSMRRGTVSLDILQAAAFGTLNLPTSPLVPLKAFDFQFGTLADPGALLTDRPDGTSPLGTPVFGRITLGDPKKGTNDYTDAQGNAGSYETVDLDCALVDVDFNSKVVVTNIQGASTSIKEFIASGDNDITIKGVFNSTPGVAPLDFIHNLNQIFKCPQAIPVENYYLNALDIYWIVIMPGTTMGQVEGGYATQFFTIKAVSDIPSDELLP